MQGGGGELQKFKTSQKNAYAVNIGRSKKTLDKKAIIHYNVTANGEVPKWLKGLPC